MSTGGIIAGREVSIDPVDVPSPLRDAVAGYRWARDTVGEAGAAVYRLYAPDRPALYLKCGEGEVADAVADEMARMRWLGQCVAVPAVCDFVATGDATWLLMDAVPGITAWQALTADGADRVAIVAALADHLRTLHALPVDRCPFDSSARIRMAAARRRIDADMVDVEDFGDAHEGWSADDVWQAMVALLPLPFERVVTHGDYSLDNIMLVDTRVVGCIDLGRVGVSDPYQDLAIMADCLEEIEPALPAILFSNYGLADVDRNRLRFHLCLDEMF